EPKGGVVSRIGDVPIKVIYLLGAVVATVAAVLLVFVVFPGRRSCGRERWEHRWCGPGRRRPPWDEATSPRKPKFPLFRLQN
ncbi:hypothetical protein, partial [Nonomuraea sp. SBT364]|uniref:hypothetical protein n=1 Tax=Nonomuraea sp. SBT364 TaxID=1580530 RepID=UPI001E464B61